MTSDRERGREKMNNRRMATRPHYKHTAEREYLLATAATFITGAMCGAVIVLGVFS